MKDSWGKKKDAHNVGVRKFQRLELLKDVMFVKMNGLENLEGRPLRKRKPDFRNK